MKPFEIALFKHFIDARGMATVYINLYRRHRLKQNPVSIEEFLANADANDVCIKAFYFVANDRWGVEYWRQMQKDWMTFLSENQNNYSADKWWKMHGIAQILRCNWDAAKHWKQEARYTAAVRLGIDLALLGLDDKKHNAPATKMSEEYLREKSLESFKNAKKTTIAASVEKETTEPPLIDFVCDDDADNMDVLGDFVDVEISPKANDKRRLKDGEISINTRNKQGRVTFNQTVSKTIKERGGYEYAALLRNKKGDVIIKLNDEKGVPVQDGTRTRGNSNVVIHSLAFVGKLVDFLNIERDYVIANIKEVASTTEYVAFLVTTK